MQNVDYEELLETDNSDKHLKVNIDFGYNNFNQIVQQEINKFLPIKEPKMLMKPKETSIETELNKTCDEHGDDDTCRVMPGDSINHLVQQDNGQNTKQLIHKVVDNKDQSLIIMNDFAWLKQQKRQQLMRRGNFVSKNTEEAYFKPDSAEWEHNYNNKIVENCMK